MAKATVSRVQKKTRTYQGIPMGTHHKAAYGPQRKKLAGMLKQRRAANRGYAGARGLRSIDL